jgi:ankyrin repeat protein
LLIGCGADVDKPDTRGLTPLHTAVIAGSETSAHLLIDYGADVNKQDQRRATPLYYVAREGREVTARSMIDHGAHVNKSDQRGATPLHVVARDGHEAMVQLLIDCGADMSLSINRVGTALEIAENRGHNSVRQLLEQTQRANESVGERLRRGESIESIIEDGAQVPVVFSYASSGQKEQLIGEYPRILCNYLHEKNELRDAIARHSIPGKWLLYAAQAGHVGIMDALLQKDDIINNMNEIKDQSGNQATHIATLYNRPHILKKLVRAGAVLDHLNSNEQTLYAIAKARNHKAIGRILSRYALTTKILQQPQHAQQNRQRNNNTITMRDLPPEMHDYIVRLVPQ